MSISPSIPIIIGSSRSEIISTHFENNLKKKDGKEALTNWSPHLIYVEGGNTFWLQHCIEKGNWSDQILNACTGDTAAVYCGKSAGAIVAGQLVETATWKVCIYYFCEMCTF